MNDAFTEQFLQVAQWLAESESTVVFTGAGISTESGISDFRSPGGVWSQSEPVYFDDFVASETARAEYWRQKAAAYDEFAGALPNVGHEILAKWESSGQLEAIVTQNIDELHQQAGSRRVLELHGTARKVVCLSCDSSYSVDEATKRYHELGAPPPCPLCNGSLKHATVSFGQALPQEVVTQATQLARDADLFFAIGSSLVVYPAAGLPQIAAESGGKLVIINRDPTPLDPLADSCFHLPIGTTLQQLDTVLRTC